MSQNRTFSAAHVPSGAMNERNGLGGELPSGCAVGGEHEAASGEPSRAVQAAAVLVPAAAFVPDAWWAARRVG